MNTVSPQITDELRVLLISFLSGAVLVTVYDVFRICRKVLRHPTALVIIEDISYGVFCAIAVAGVYYEVNEGMIRGFALFGMAAGMLVDDLLLSPLLIYIICGLIGKLEKLFLKPFRFLKNLLKKIIKLVKISLCKL